MIKKSLFFTLALIALNGFAQDGVLPTIVPETDANLSTLTARAGTTRYSMSLVLVLLPALVRWNLSVIPMSSTPCMGRNRA